MDRNAPLAEERVPPEPAEIYELFAVPALFAPAAERLLAAARPLPGERVLDVGAGTGIVARRAASLVGAAGHVAALDASGEMLTVARAAANREGLAIDWHEGQAEQLPFQDGSFDLVVCQYALMFFSDVPAALAEMRRVLRPAGRLALSVFQSISRHPFYASLEEAIARHLGYSTVAAIFALGNADALGAFLERAGFRDVAIEPYSWSLPMGQPDPFLAGEIAIDRASIPALQGLDLGAALELTEAIAAEMAEPLRAVTKGGEVVMEFHDLVATACH